MEDLPVVGTFVQVGDDQVLSCDQKLLTDSIHLLLTYLTEKPEIIHLDNRDEALISEGRVIVSDNYLLAWNNKQNPFKLFDRKGNFLTTIGSYGQGPNEYLNVYDANIDEENDRIYILPWQSAQILVYDLKGNPQPTIPLCLPGLPKDFPCRPSGFDGCSCSTSIPRHAGSSMDTGFSRNRKDYIEPGHLAAPQDYSNEVCTYNNVPVFLT